MFDALKTLILHKVQSHDNTVIHFNRRGIHRISGDNSHGKSTIFKSLYALCLGELTDKVGRDSLINWGSDFCIISGESFNGVILTLYLHLESSKCFYELTYGETKIRKYFSDDYKTLLKVANFHYFPEDKFSLNRYKPKTTLPFTHTSGTLNYKILDSASEVVQARDSLVVLDEKLKEIKFDRDNIERKIIAFTEQIKIMDDSGIDKLKNRIAYLDRLNSNYHKVKPIMETIERLKKDTKEISSLKLMEFKEVRGLIEQLKSVNEIGNLLNHVVVTNNQIEEFNNNNIQEPENINPIINILKLLYSMNTSNEQLLHSSKELIELKEFNLVNIDNLIKAKNNLHEIANSLTVMKNAKVDLNSLNNEFEPKPLNDELKELNYLFEISKLFKGISKNHHQLNEVNRNLSILDTDINSLAKEIGICKHCGGVFTDNHHHNLH